MGCGPSKPADVERKVGETVQVNYDENAKHKGPRDAICHICGRKYTVHSINIHIPQCEKKFLAQQEQLPKKERKKLPMLPKGVSKMQIEERNQVAQKLYEDSVMEKCPYCNRNFMEGRLAKHINACAKSHGKVHHQDSKDSAPNKYHSGPTEAKNTVICYVCGRKYTTHSIDIHVKQCKELFMAREAKKPKKDRKPLPKEPKHMTLQERNEYATKQYNDTVLEACKYCGRTFFPDRLAVHIKSCQRSHLKKQ